MKYSEKLRDPRWQKRRLEIMQRDDWRCQCCFSTTGMLTVHHRIYISGREPWEYDDDLLVTLCEDCHKDEHEQRQIAENNVLRAFKQMGYHYTDLQCIAQAIINAGRVGNLAGWRGIMPDIVGHLSEHDLVNHTHPTPQKIEGLK